MTFFKRLLLIVISLLLFVVCLFYVTCRFVAIKGQNYFINEGWGLSYVSYDLKNLGIISSSLQFKMYSKIWSIIHGCGGIKFGEYSISYNESYNSLLDKFCNGKTVVKSLTIPEGFEIREVINLINNSKDLVGNKILSFEEGKILPETYHFQSGLGRDVIFLKMQQELNTFLSNEWEKRDKNDAIKTPEEAIILASIVEKEAKTDEERPIIADVYINRLLIGMRLEACPTAIYEITKGKYKLSRPLTRNDLLNEGEYNTYRKKGLPIAPICNPGKKSILAVLHPAKTNYLYFISKADLSGNIFAENYKDHLKNIQSVKLLKSQNGGDK